MVYKQVLSVDTDQEYIYYHVSFCYMHYQPTQGYNTLLTYG